MAEKEMKIYKITNMKNNKIYIGRTCQNIKTRLNQHFSDSRYILINCPLHYDMKKFQKNDFKIEEVYAFNTDNFKMADKIELEYILKFNSFVPSGYNVRRIK